MKTKILILATSLLVAGGCDVPGYLPRYGDLVKESYGSYISVIDDNNNLIKGELIAADSNQLIVFSKTDGKCVDVYLNNDAWFTIYYAQPLQYGWTIPLFTLATAAHGVFLIYTAPFNLIYTIIVTAAGNSVFTYNKTAINITDLKKFARFPQGLPPGFNSDKITGAPFDK